MQHTSGPLISMSKDLSPLRGVLLSDYKTGAKRPSVFLLWEVDYSNSLTRLGLVCICSSRSLAELRVKSMNSSSFWKDTNKQVRYTSEECEIDHLFASDMLGYDLQESKDYDQMAHQQLWWPSSDEARIERIRSSYLEKIKELQDRIKTLESKLENV